MLDIVQCGALRGNHVRTLLAFFAFPVLLQMELAPHRLHFAFGPNVERATAQVLGRPP